MNDWLTELWLGHKKIITSMALVLIAAWASTKYLLLPARDQEWQTTALVAELHQKIQQAEALIAQVKTDEPARINMHEELDLLTKHRLAPCHNPVSWIAERIDESAKPAGLQINAVTEIEGWAPIWSHAASSNRLLQTCAARIETESDFNAIAQFLKELESANPYSSMSHISIIQRKQSIDKYLINLVMEWPQWCE